MHLCIWDMKIPFWASSCVSMCKPATLDETEWLLICRIMQQPNLIQLTCSRWRWLFVFYHGDHVMTSISLGILPSHRTNIEKYEGSKPIASCWVQEEAGANRSFVEAGSQSSLLQDAIERNGYAAEPFKSLHGSLFWICRKHASRCLCRFSRCLVRPLRHDVVFPRTQNNTWCKAQEERGCENTMRWYVQIPSNSNEHKHIHTHTDWWLFRKLVWCSSSGTMFLFETFSTQLQLLWRKRLLLSCSSILHGRNQGANAMKLDIVIGAFNESQLLRLGEPSSFQNIMHWTFHRIVMVCSGAKNAAEFVAKIETQNLILVAPK